MQVKSVVGLLKRYEGLFQLPSRIRQSTEKGEFDQVTPLPCLQMLTAFLSSTSGFPRFLKWEVDNQGEL